jgi:hypothetical protein
MKIPIMSGSRYPHHPPGKARVASHTSEKPTMTESVMARARAFRKGAVIRPSRKDGR